MEGKHGLKVEVASQKEKFPLAGDTRVLIFESIRELLFNIVKHSGVKKAQVAIAENGKMLEIKVKDLGKGFEPSNLKKVGENGGFGLFSIMERIELIGGEFNIRSALGEGACFSILAPLAEADVESPATPIRSLENIENFLVEGSAKIRLLLVDDHMVMREGLARLLSQEPDIDIVGQANDGYEAVQLSGELQPDVVLMDISMPGLNGIEATKIIKQRHNSIKVIGLSLYEEDDRAREMLNAGAVKYLSKSGPASGVKDAIRGCLKRGIQGA
jgi:CheY-like chemotaxis protein